MADHTIAKKASRLDELAAHVSVEPLRSGDPRWVDLSQSRGDDDLKRLRIMLSDFSAADGNFAKIAFTGHRGCGKSTELFRLAHELAQEQRIFPVHLFADETLLRDCDYTDLMLWTVDSLVNEFAKHNLHLDSKLVNAVVDWFAKTSVEKVDKLKSEIRAEAEAEAKAGANVYWYSLRLIARLKSMMKGSTERRTTMRRELQRFASELIDQVNLLLDEAARTLEDQRGKADLLIIQDNLDRLPPDVARTLFLRNGGFLKSLNAHIIYTVPIAMVLAPYNITSEFENCFTMPMVKVHQQNNRPYRPGVAGFHDVLTNRMELDSIFKSESIAKKLIKMSGGSVRDLMRLINYAQLVARGDGKTVIDKPAANAAITKMRIEFEKLLIPGQTYYPILFHVHQTKRPWLPEAQQENPAVVQSFRDFFSQLLFNGTVLEYNGEESWYDVHPIVREINDFRETAANL